MIWFDGLVEVAVQKALKEKKIFLVYVEGDDDDSKKMETTWNSDKVTACCSPAKCVAIRVKGGSIQCEQFAQCYPLLCIPSTYLINDQGVPKEIIPGYLDAPSFLERIAPLFQENVDQHSTDLANSVSSGNEQPQPETAQAAEKDAALGPTDKGDPSQSEEDLPDRVAQAQELIAERRDKQKQDELREKREKEKKRRDEGYQLGMAKKNREETESKKWVDEQAKAKAEAKAAREAVRLKLEQDRAEKKARFQYDKEEERAKKDLRRRAVEAPKAPTTTEERKTTRIQFRLPNGSTFTKEFPSETKLSEVITSISKEDMVGTANITLATVYPRRKFSTSEHDSTLLTLNLVPSASLIVILERSNGTTGSTNSVLDFIKFIILPFVTLLMYIKTLIFGQSQVSNTSALSNMETSNSSRSRLNDKKSEETMAGYKKEGKIYQFKQDDADDDDEKKTWNGNSTQQM